MQISAEDTFEHDLRLPELEPHIRRLAEKAWAGYEKERAPKDGDASHARIARTVVLKLKTHDFRILTRSFTPEAPPASAEEFTAIALALLLVVGNLVIYTLWARRRLARRITHAVDIGGVKVGGGAPGGGAVDDQHRYRRHRRQRPPGGGTVAGRLGDGSADRQQSRVRRRHPAHPREAGHDGHRGAVDRRFPLQRPSAAGGRAGLRRGAGQVPDQSGATSVSARRRTPSSHN